MEELRKAVQATEKNRQAAMRALAEERQRSLELQVKISRQVLVKTKLLQFSQLSSSVYFLDRLTSNIRFDLQKETAAALEEEVRVLKVIFQLA